MKMSLILVTENKNGQLWFSENRSWGVALISSSDGSPEPKALSTVDWNKEKMVSKLTNITEI